MLLALALGSGPGGACSRPSGEPLITYFNAEHALTVRYPASWKTDEAEQEGVFYRYFLGPPAGQDQQPAISVTLLAGPLGVPLEQYAQSYLAGNQLLSSQHADRQGAQGRSYVFRSADGGTRYSLLLLAEDRKVYGLYAQGAPASVERYRAALEEMGSSLTLERLEGYPLQRDKQFAFSLRVPRSWRETRRFAGGGTLLLQYTSPALAADKGGQTVHSSLTVTVEAIPGDGSFETYYQGSRAKLGDAFQLLHHGPWQGSGCVDVMRSETPVAVSRVKRYYRAADRRGYSLTFEAREDVYPRVFRWYDLMASSFKTGAEAAP